MYSINEENRKICQQIDELRKVLIGDVNACEMKWTLFVSAAHSFRHDTLLKPFPSHFNDIEKIRNLISKVPAFNELLIHLMKNHSTATIDDEFAELISLLHWILVKLHDPTLKSVTRSHVSSFGLKKKKKAIRSTIFLIFIVPKSKCK